MITQHRKGIQILAGCLGLAIAASQVQGAEVEYGVDVSYPMHDDEVSINYPWLPHNLDPSLPVPEHYEGMPLQPLGDRASFYSHYINGCFDHYNEKNGRGGQCINNEDTRIRMNKRQPQSMVNYTKTGFTKIRAPDELMSLLKEFWATNKDRAEREKWGVGNIYTNHWTVPTKMLSVEDVGLKGGGHVLKEHIWDAARSTISKWTGQEVSEVSLYGIRIYEEGAVLATHVDRLPLVSSAIINVDQDVDEPWPLEVIGHDGKAHNVTMLPGDLVLYESHSILHGRPFPLKGRFMANVFIHFEPIGPIGGEILTEGDLPAYLIPGSKEEVVWRQQNPSGWKVTGRRKSFETGSSEAHHLAVNGYLDELKTVLDQQGHLVNLRDRNLWTPLHESVRRDGNLPVVKFLVERGADVNARTSDGRTALRLSKEKHGEGHPIVSFLEEIGAQDLGPEL